MSILTAREAFKLSKSAETVSSKEYGLSKKQTSLSSDNSGQNILDKFLKLREKDLAMKRFNIDFQHFLAWLSKFLLCVASWSFLLIVYLSLNTNIKSKYLQKELKKIIINKP